jgi:hypothetical protein
MGKKIFVSYKYSDRLVRQLQGHNTTTVRDYVDILEKKIDRSDHIYKGENDDESLKGLSEATIGAKLSDKIFDSTVTVVIVSKGMKAGLPEKEQWIPWEIAYSLKRQTRGEQVSKTNAVLAVALPDENARYDYYIKGAYPYSNRGDLNTSFLFGILRENMFNLKYQTYEKYPSFIHSIEWDDFIKDINRYIDIALKIRANINDYNVRKNV